jgi:DNA-directed RNA polymerase subunit beta'
MALGFRHAFKAGISFGKDDMVIPDTKGRSSTRPGKVQGVRAAVQDGLITQGEKYNKVVDAWSKCTDKVADEMMKAISAVQKDGPAARPINSIYMMAHSGARGSPAQMKQLAGMRGLMAKPSGEIIETPIISNFKEGLTVLEYFNSTHGARKGLADTALKTANSGYLTRRLVDVAQDCIIVEDDCGTDGGITDAADRRWRSGRRLAGERILGRTAAEDVKRPGPGDDLLVKRGKLIDERGSPSDRARPAVQEVRIRSVLTCEAKGRLRQVLRPRPGARHAGQHRRGGRRHRRPVDRRAGHAADHAHLPHRRRGAGGRAVVHRSNFDGKVKIRNRNVVRTTRTAS